MAPTEYDPLLESPLRKPQARKPLLRDILGQTHFLIIWLGPTLIFTLTSFFWTWRFLYQPVFCIMWSVTLCFAASSALLMAPSGVYRWLTPLCILTFPAVGFGSFIGLFLYDEYAIYPEFYKNTRKYTNVVPAQPATAVADAGKIVFSTGTFVDVSQSVGLIEETGVKYCVSPIRDGSGIERIEFWAAGIGCCGASGDFYCDAASNSEAHAGIVIFDNNGYFEKARYDFYDKARKKAQAQYSLQSVSHPTYVRWVKESDLDMLTHSYGLQAFMFEIVTMIIYGIGSLGIAWILWDAKPMMPGRTTPP